jgi:hypothetical protein
MPEALPPRVSRSHTSTAEWKSFEIRMRRRRLGRCLLRAEVALEAGCFDDARLALAEARQLEPQEPSLDELEARVAAMRAVPPPPPPERARSNGPLLVIAAVLVLAIPSAWLLTRTPTPPQSQAPVATAERITIAPEPMPTLRVGVREQVITPEVVTVPDAPVRPEPTGPRAAATTPVARPEPPPAAPPQSRATPTPTATASSTRPPPATRPEPESMTAAAPAARTPLPAAPPPSAAPDLPTRAPAAPAPIEPAATGTSGTRAAAREPAPEPAVDPAAETVSRIQGVLSRYEAAYSGLDAAAARAVWPSVDQRALARAFNNLESQRISLDQCSVAVDGASARAECRGSATWVPKVGSGGRTEARRWTFDLRQASGGWHIVRADAR